MHIRHPILFRKKKPPQKIETAAYIINSPLLLFNKHSRKFLFFQFKSKGL